MLAGGSLVSTVGHSGFNTSAHNDRETAQRLGVGVAQDHDTTLSGANRTPCKSLPHDNREAGRRSKAEDQRTTAAFGPAATAAAKAILAGFSSVSATADTASTICVKPGSRATTGIINFLTSDIAHLANSTSAARYAGHQPKGIFSLAARAAATSTAIVVNLTVGAVAPFLDTVILQCLSSDLIGTRATSASPVTALSVHGAPAATAAMGAQDNASRQLFQTRVAAVRANRVIGCRQTPAMANPDEVLARRQPHLVRLDKATRTTAALTADSGTSARAAAADCENTGLDAH